MVTWQQMWCAGGWKRWLVGGDAPTLNYIRACEVKSMSLPEGGDRWSTLRVNGVMMDPGPEVRWFLLSEVALITRCLCSLFVVQTGAVWGAVWWQNQSELIDWLFELRTRGGSDRPQWMNCPTKTILRLWRHPSSNLTELGGRLSLGGANPLFNLSKSWKRGWSLINTQKCFPHMEGLHLTGANIKERRRRMKRDLEKMTEKSIGFVLQVIWK